MDRIIKMTEELTELVPDAFNMKSSRIVVVYGEKQDKLWDMIYDVFDGKVSRDKIDGFRAGSGTILYFYDRSVIEDLQNKFSLYSDNFQVWASQSSGMLQLSVWSGLREINVGASLQHYNPVIDNAVKKFLNFPKEYVLVAEMPFGRIVKEPEPKDKEDIKNGFILFVN